MVYKVNPAQYKKSAQILFKNKYMTGRPRIIMENQYIYPVTFHFKIVRALSQRTLLRKFRMEVV